MRIVRSGPWGAVVSRETQAPLTGQLVERRGALCRLPEDRQGRKAELLRLDRIAGRCRHVEQECCRFDLPRAARVVRRFRHRNSPDRSAPPGPVGTITRWRKT